MSDDHPTTPPPSLGTEPVEAATMPPSEFGKTQPLPPVTASDVLDVFMSFQQQILERLDERDRRVLEAIKQIGSDVFQHYATISKRGDENNRLIGVLRKRTHRHSSELQEIKIRVHEIERILGIELPPAPQEPEPA